MKSMARITPKLSRRTIAGESGHVEWDTYTDGLGKDEWIKENAGWLKNIPADPKDIFDAFNAEDFRAGECGGCI